MDLPGFFSPNINGKAQCAYFKRPSTCVSQSKDWLVANAQAYSNLFYLKTWHVATVTGKGSAPTACFFWNIGP